MSSPEAGAEASALGYSRVATGVAAIVAPVTLLTSIALYFGWARVVAFDDYFGLQPSIVGYSNQDYVLNSLGPLFKPVAIGLFLLMLFAIAHTLIKHSHAGGESPRRLRVIADVAFWTGLPITAFGAIVTFTDVSVSKLTGTLLLATGPILLAYGIGLSRRLSGKPPLSAAAYALVGLFAAVCLFWSAGIYAADTGRADAADLAHHLDRLPAVTIASDSDLGIPPASGVQTTAGAKPFVYSGLRLLVGKTGTLFLLPDAWRSGGRSSLLVVPAAGLQVAFSPPGVELSTADIALGRKIPTPTAPAPLPTTAVVGPVRLQVSNPARTVTVVVRNSGHVSAAGVRVTGNLPAGVTVAGKQASCRAARKRFSCSLQMLRPADSARLIVTAGRSRDDDVNLTLAYRGRTDGAVASFETR
jgi:hypothetical protein